MQLGELGARIKSLRSVKGLTQQQLAAEVGVTSQAVSTWENGENAPDILTLPSLAALLNTSVDAILGFEHRALRRVEGTVFFSAQPGYTALSETLTPEEVALRLNSHFYSITECVRDRGGMPIKYVGDAFLAVFLVAEHPMRAVEAAAATARVCEPPPAVGLATGAFYMGPIGHPDFARTDIIGEIVNLAVRVQQWAGSNTASGIAAAGSTVEGCSDSRLGPASEVTLKGFSEAMRIVEIVP